MRRLTRRMAWFLPLAVAVVVIAGAANADTSTKWYDAYICEQGTPPASCTTAPSVAANSTATLMFTLTNDSTSTQSIGSANFTAPDTTWSVSGLPSSGSVTDPMGNPGSQVWNITQGSSGGKDVVEFRANGSKDTIPPGWSVSADVTVGTTCSSVTGDWGIEVKQSNKFSGPPGNDVQPIDVQPTVNISAAALGSFVFNDIPTQSLESQPFTVTVTAKDACGNVKTDYSGGATLSGNLTGSADYGNPLSWSSGVATPSVTAVDSQIGAQLHVADGSISADSNTFNVLESYTVCNSNSILCRVTDSSGTTTADAPIPTGNQTLTVGLLSGSAVGSMTGCADTPLDGSSVVMIDPSGYSGDYTVTLTFDKSIAPGTGVANFIVCKSTDGDFWTQLDTCKNHNPQAPCILSRNRTGVGDLVETLLLDPSGDPYGGLR